MKEVKIIRTNVLAIFESPFESVWEDQKVFSLSISLLSLLQSSRHSAILHSFQKKNQITPAAGVKIFCEH